MAAAITRQILALIGFAPPVAQVITDQGHDSFDEVALLTDDEIEGLCKSLRAPGGLIPGPPLAVGGAPGPLGPNPGTFVSTRAQNNLKLLAYYLRFKQRTSMTPVVNQITLANIRALRHQRDQEEDHTEPDAPTIDGDDWPKIIETLQEFLGACLGATSLPLAYVVRRNIDPTPPPAGGWSSNEAHMIARAPIVTNPGGLVPAYTVPFQADNKQVWLKLASICRDKDCWTYIRRYQSTQNGRAAFWALHNHYLGASNVDNMSARAERKLMDTVYNGEKRRWNFEKYVRLHVEQHAVLEDLVQYGYSGIDEGSKVRYLVRGVRTQTLDTVKASILASADLRNNFTAASTLFKDFIDQTKSSQPDHDITIAGIATGAEDSDSDDAKTPAGTPLRAKPDMSVDERYYSMQEYRSLSPEKKAGLIAKREARDARGGGRDRNRDRNRNKRPGRKQQVTLSKASIAAVAAAMKGEDDSDDGNHGADDDNSDSGEEQVPMKPPAKRQKIMNNRNNPALQRRTARKST
jgi:hypothetical protein